MTAQFKGVLMAALTAWAATAGGCQPYVSPERLEKGLVVVLSGIEGRSGLTMTICQGLDNGGVDGAIEITDWASPWGPIDSLRNEQRNRRQAERIADRIADYQHDYPGRWAYVVGQSGGGGLAVWVAEAMPVNHSLDGVILLAAAISPDYDLTPALVGTKAGIVNFHSKLDWVMLGVGTSTWGTIDGEMTESAGMVGFSADAAAGAASDGPKLLQVPWSAKMLQHGHAGGHLTSGSLWFVAERVAPFIADKSRWALDPTETDEDSDETEQATPDNRAP
ncbi:MAG: hypothetical protein ACYS8X_06450 [Planctomycetota bacterium]|jgi:hypothetical protein